MLSLFRSSHAHVKVVIYVPEQISFLGSGSDRTRQKPSHFGAAILLKRAGENVQNKESEMPEEHIPVCLSSSPSNERIVRMAGKTAQAFCGSLTALYVQISGGAKHDSRKA